MNFGELIYLQPENLKKLIRKIENLEKKLANARVAILFNKTCLNENILPKFTNIYKRVLISLHICRHHQNLRKKSSLLLLRDNHNK